MRAPEPSDSGSSGTRSAFWDDLAELLQDPENLRIYIAASEEIQEFDRQANAALESSGDPSGPPPHSHDER